MSSSSTKAFELPKIRKIFKTGLDNPDSEGNHFWDAKFYPFDHNHEAPPIFAISNAKNILVCRVSSDQDNDIEVLRVFTVSGDEQFRDDYCSCTWAFIKPDEPLLLGAGESGLIRVFDVVNGGLKLSLLGHGQGVINDLATHPKYPWIVASASQDTSVRIWDLRRWSDKYESPCVILCGHGNGHWETLLSVSWHDNGRYLVTGAHDHRVCIWTIPDLSPESSFWEEISPSQRKRSSDEVRIIYYPHFITSAVHTNFVDCVRFWGDLILSKAAEENKIVLWSITGFNSRCQPPDAILAPKTEEHLDTRNGFMRTLTIDDNGVQTMEVPELYQTKLPYTRLLEFSVPSSRPFFLRFDLLKPSPAHPDLHPVLAIGNTQSQVFFFDLQAIELGYNPLANSPRKRKYGPTKKGIPIPLDRGRFKQSNAPSTSGAASTPSSSRDRSSSLHRPSSTETGATSELFSTTFNDRLDPSGPSNPQRSNSHQPQQPPQADRDRYPLHLPRKPLDPTKTHKLPDFTQATFTSRGVGWSPDGRWCVFAGETAERMMSAGKVEREKLKEEASTFRRGRGRGGSRGGRKNYAMAGKGRKGEGEDVSVGAAVVFGRW